MGKGYVYSGVKFVDAGIGEIGESRNRARYKRAKDRERKISERETHVKKSSRVHVGESSKRRNSSYMYKDEWEYEY